MKSLRSKNLHFHENIFHKLILNMKIQLDEIPISGVWYSDSTLIKTAVNFINWYKILQH